METAAQIDVGRALMRAAFLELAELAQRAGADPEKVRELSWRLFDGNQAINEALSQ